MARVCATLTTSAALVKWLACGFVLTESYDTREETANTEKLRALLVQAVVDGTLPHSVCTEHTRGMVADALEDLLSHVSAPDWDDVGDSSAQRAAFNAYQAQLQEAIVPLRAWLEQKHSPAVG